MRLMYIYQNSDRTNFQTTKDINASDFKIDLKFKKWITMYKVYKQRI